LFLASPAGVETRTSEAFDIASVLRRIRVAIRRYPKAMLFQLAEEGHDSPFEQLVACIVSIRTLDEVSRVEASRLLKAARTPERMAGLGVKRIDALIRGSTFHEAKARQIHDLATGTLLDHGGKLPCDGEALMKFRGVGPKCANLVLGIACGKRDIGVDIHVHRITNRWGYVAAPTPEKTLAALRERLPRRYWVEINRLLVPFGKHICRGTLPRCSTCPVLSMCRQVGVTRHA
jgi:endonuclease-3